MATRKPVNRVAAKRRPTTNVQSGSTVRRRASGRVTARPDGTAAGRSIGVRTAAPRSGAERGAPDRASRWTVRRPLPGRRGTSDGTWWRTWRVPVLCTAAAVVLAVVAVVAAFRPGVGDGNRAFVDNKGTDQVKAAAQQALVKIYSYDPKDLDRYKATARSALTGSALTDFDKNAKALDTSISAAQQAQTKADVTADPVSVTLLTSDHAQLLVNMTVNSTKDGVPQAGVTGPVVVRMQQVNGRWLASDISDH